MRLKLSALGVVNTIILLFLLAPLIIVVATSFTSASFLKFPPVGFSLKWYKAVLTEAKYMTPFFTSLRVGLTSVAIAILVGIPCAAGLAKGNFPGRTFITSIVLAPIMLPTIVLAIGLLMIYSKPPLNVPFWRLVLSHAVISTPYLVRTLLAALTRFDWAQKEAALNLGASRLVAWLTVVLPSLRPALMSGLFFAFIISFDELVIALFLTSPKLVTLPIRVYGEIQYNLDPAIAAVSSLLIMMTVTVMLVVARVFGLRRPL